jgi:predicted transcriptional regulator YheO
MHKRAEKPTADLVAASSLRPHFAVAQGIAALFTPFVEVAVHDLASDSVACVVNPFSPRKVGDPSDLKGSRFADDVDVLGPYEKVNFDGRLIKSISIVLRDAALRPIGLMCINADVTEFDAVRRMLHGFLGAAESTDSAIALFKEDWHERINRFIAAWTAEQATTIARLDRAGRRALIEALFVNGGFEGKRAPEYVAAILGISRATIYGELARLRTGA